MLIKSAAQCRTFIANDGCEIRELLHPANDAVDMGFSLAVAAVAPGAQSYRHRLCNTEVYYILAGAGVMHIGADERPVSVGDAVLIPPNRVQWISNPHAEILRFVAIVSPPWRRQDDERLEPTTG